jgi:hypothetical protein
MAAMEADLSLLSLLALRGL